MQRDVTDGEVTDGDRVQSEVTDGDETGSGDAAPAEAGAGTTRAPGQPAYEIPPQVLHREVDGQMVLLDLASERYFGLNETGAAIVDRLTRQPYDEAIAALTGDYEVAPDKLRRDVRELVDSLLDAGLLRERSRDG